ncbi:MAG: putative sugar nucleotidyl transferase [Bacteroidota bacterium]
MQHILFEDQSHLSLLPFTFTRPVWRFRVGISTNVERWRRFVPQGLRGFTVARLQELYGEELAPESSLWIHGGVIPTDEVWQLLSNLGPDEYATDAKGQLLSARFSPLLLPPQHEGLLTIPLLEEMDLKAVPSHLSPLRLAKRTDLFDLAGTLIRHDFPLVVAESPESTLDDPYTRVYGKDNLYVHPTARVKAAILNAEDGPIYLGPKVKVEEGAIIRRTHAIGANSTVGVGAKLRGDSSLGMYCKAAGELTNSVLLGYANKGHDGYLGNGVLGYWCNLGADTNASNLKNNYGEVKTWDYVRESFQNSGKQFCGLMMGDHSKCGINTMFNTGTVVGIFANVFGAGFPPKFIPSFSWGGADGLQTYRFDKAKQVARTVLSRRQQVFSPEEERMLQAVFQETAKFRNWEKEKKVSS